MPGQLKQEWARTLLKLVQKKVVHKREFFPLTRSIVIDELLEGLSVDPQCRAHLSWVWDDIVIIAKGQFEGTLYYLVQERGEIPKKDSAMWLD